MFEYSGRQDYDKKIVANANLILIASLTAVTLITSSLTALAIYTGQILNLNHALAGAILVTTILAMSALSVPLSFYLSKICWAPMSHILMRLRLLTIDAGHELATPVTVINSRMQLLEHSAALNNCPNGDLEAIKTALRDLTALVSDMRLLAASDLAKRRANLAFIELNHLVAESLSELQNELSLRKISFDLTAQSKAVVIGDKNGLKRVISNLLINAIKYSDESSIIDIAISADEKESTVKITNLGRIIAEGDMPFIFNRYFRAQAETEGQAKGSGLGLAIVKDIIDAHGGKIRVESFEGKGNTFVLVIPKAPISHPALTIFE